ncbi:MAG TPA: hypothetical protein VLE53_05340 [Gemmatimonadaceae bacterium]|nr:hypothetical protein [Gemmatimonadaceae bacterium]
MADTPVSKREARKQRSEAERLQREHAKRQKAMKSRLYLIVGAIVVLLIGVLYARRDEGSSVGGAGRVWSPEHGHWHDR